MVTLNRITAIFFCVLAGVAILFGILALPQGGLFFALPYLLFMVAGFLALLGGLHFLAERGFRKQAPWRWVAQAMTLDGDLSELLQHGCDYLDGILAVSRAIDGHSISLKSQKKFHDRKPE